MLTIAAIKDWAQTIVLVGSVVVSCVVLVFKIGGYTQRLESAIADATAAAKLAVKENGAQQKQIDLLITAEARRAKDEEEERAEARRRREQARPFGGYSVQ